MNIRKAGPGDTEAVMELLRRQMRKRAERDPDSVRYRGENSGIAPELYFRENIASFLLAEQEGCLTGTVGIFDEETIWKNEAKACYLRHFVQDEEHPECGTTLLRVAEKMAVLRNRACMRTILPLRDHVRAAFLETGGYRTAGITRLADCWLVKMEKHLDRENPPYDAGGFFDSELLQDGDIQLVLEKTSPADPERDWVPAYQFAICGIGGERMGSCDLRIGHNEKLYYSGNIGYQVDEPYRGRHVAARACGLLFRLAEKHGLGYVIITCRPDNAASRRTAERAGCELLETAALPAWHDLAKEGASEECIYGKSLGED